MELSRLTTVDAADRDVAVALLPVGSTEQHGPHAPLGTDTIAAEAVATRAGEQVPDVIVGPTLPIGVAAEHRHFTGTLWVSPDTFRAYVRETMESLAAHGWDRVIVVNGHGGNVDALREVCATVRREGTCLGVPFTWFDAVDPADQPMGHGGGLETAAMRYLEPETVREDRTEVAATEGSDRWGDWHGGTNLAVDTIEFSRSGVVGDPRTTDAADGERFITTAVEALVDLIGAVRDRQLRSDEEGGDAAD